jgi:hypothetical protein
MMPFGFDPLEAEKSAKEIRDIVKSRMCRSGRKMATRRSYEANLFRMG